jgi:biopolymer transport protein ExbD
MPSITVVSLIDILAILLIFFIVTTTFKEKLPQLQINLPESKSASTSSTETKKAIPLQIKGPEQITMQADKEAPFGTVVAVLDALQAAGVKNVPAVAKPYGK